MKRRHLLQLAGSTLATLGLSQLHLQQQSRHYGRMLAQSTRRKRALLVGINEYPATSRFTSLKGCVTDVELQEYLLRHRFGFTDIEILTDAQASRDNILTTFEEFLIKPCQDDDVVVFHFSGHGRRILDRDDGVRSLTDAERQDYLNGAIAPADDDSGLRREKVASDIMGRTLFLLTSALKTPNVTVVLDSCYSGGGIRGDHRVRSADPNDPATPASERLAEYEFQASQTEVDYQNRWITELALSDEEVKQRRDMGIAKGMALAAAQGNQKAIDAKFTDFNAGAFTYFLTQYLWHEADSLTTVIDRVTANLEEKNFQQKPMGCLVEVGCNSGQDRSVYFVEPQETDATPADGILMGQEGSRGKIWLGGSAPNSLVTYGTGAQFIPVEPDGTVHDPVTVLQRNGLDAEISLNQPLPIGTRLVEVSRVIPRNLKLRVGIDPSLGELGGAIALSIEEWDGGKRFQFVFPREESINDETQPVYDGGELHYILSRLTVNYRDLLRRAYQDNLPESERLALLTDNSIVLFSPGIESIVPGFPKDDSQSVSDIINNLKIALSSLRNARNLKLAVNTRRMRLSDDDVLRSRLPAMTSSLDRSDPRNPYGESGLPRNGGNIPACSRSADSVSAEQVASNSLINITVRIRIINNARCMGSDRYLDLSVDRVKIPLGTKFQFEVSNHETDEIHLYIAEVDPTGDITPLLPITTSDETNISSGFIRIVPNPATTREFIIATKIQSEFLMMVSKNRPINLADPRAGASQTDVFLANLSGLDLEQRDAADTDFKIVIADSAAFTIPFEVVDP